MSSKQHPDDTLRQQMIDAARKVGGSARTVARRIEAAKRFHDWLRASNYQQRDIRDLNKVALVASWIESISGKDRHKQNSLSQIRGMFRGAGMTAFADLQKNHLLTTKALGIDGASREGAHRPPTDAEWVTIEAKLAHPDYACERAMFRLCKALGLRQEEGVQGSAKSLGRWLAQLRAGNPVRVIYGTKSSKARDTFVPPAMRPVAIAAVQEALALARQQSQGRLIDKPSLKQALERVQTVAQAVGLVGEISPHALRCDFSWRFARELLADGYSRQDVLAQLALSLGHGDGRGRYCKQVYLRGFDWGCMNQPDPDEQLCTV